MKTTDFIENNRVFTFSQWKKEGFTKDDLKQRNDTVYYATFLVSVRGKDGKTRDQYEKVYIVDEKLAELYKKLKRAGRRHEDTAKITGDIKEMVASIFETYEKEQGEYND